MTPSVTNDSVNKDQFLQLFVSQVQSQNPLEPMSNSEFMSQVSMFTMVEQTTNMAASFEQVLDNSERSLALARFNQATGLIGRQVTFYDSATGLSAEGMVDGVTELEGAAYLEVDDYMVLPTAVISVRPG